MSFPKHSEYVETDVPWLGKVPVHWQVIRIRRLFEIKKTIAGELGFDVFSVTKKGFRVKDIESGEGQLSMDYSKYQIVEVGDFAMNPMDLLTGGADIATAVGVTSPDYRVFAIRDDALCHDRYLLYVLQMAYRNKIFYAYGQGSSQLGRWRLPRQQFNDFPFPVPPKEEQTTIASFLDAETSKIDALVVEQRRLIELLKEKRQAVISHAVTKGLNPNAPMKPSGIQWLGDVPQHWEVSQLRRLTDSLSNGLFKKKDQFGQGTLLLNVFDVYREDFQVNFEQLDRVNCTDEEITSYQVLPGDLFLVRSSLKQEGIAVVCVAGECDEPVVYECHLIRARPDSSILAGRFGSYVLNSAVYRAKLVAKAKVTTMTTIDQESIHSTKIPVPPLEEQTAIASFLDAATSRIDSLAREVGQTIDLLQERRTALISTAVTGKIDVREFAHQETA